MKQIVFKSYGEPDKVAEVAEAPMPIASADEVIVQMEAAPINPADLLRLSGQALRSALPSVAGAEGVGRVVSVGGEVKDVAVGTRVLLPPGCPTWTQFAVAQAGQVIPLPDDIDVQQAAMLSINPMTAWCLLDLVPLNKGDWIIQNAANSAVARLVVRMAARRGIHTVNVVRRENVKDELVALGADVVVVDGDGLAARVAAETHGAKIVYGLDAIAGAATERLCMCLAGGATLVVYGLLSGQPIQLPTSRIVFEDIKVRGFSRFRAVMQLGPAEARRRYLELAKLVKDGTIHTPVDAVYPLTEVKRALEHAQRDGRDGKVYLLPNAA